MIWIDGQKCGVNFDVPLDYDTVVEVRAFADNYARIARNNAIKEAGLWVDGQGRSGFGD